jgi:hypothetical protein
MSAVSNALTRSASVAKELLVRQQDVGALQEMALRVDAVVILNGSLEPMLHRANPCSGG